MLTLKQKNFFQYLSNFTFTNGYFPTYREICRDCDFKSDASVGRYLDALEEKGYIKRDTEYDGSISLCSPGKRQIFELGSIAAGQPIEAIENPVLLEVPESMVEGNEPCYALRVIGDSMIDDGILDGDLVLIRSQSSADNGDTVVAVTEDGATLKRFYKEITGRVRLEPRNPRLEPFYPSSLEIRGKFIGLIRYGASFLED